MGPSKVQRFRIFYRVKKWASVLKRAADEHGRPNSFGVVELATEYGLKKYDGYFVGRRRLPELGEDLGGHDRWGSCPTYSKGRFYV